MKNVITQPNGDKILETTTTKETVSRISKNEMLREKLHLEREIDRLAARLEEVVNTLSEIEYEANK